VKILFVLAHHEPTSLNAALVEDAAESLRSANHEVKVSDLYGMGFDPVSDRRNFVTVKDQTRLKQQAEEEFAAQTHGFAPDIQAEMDKLMWSDALILQFPLWWCSMPAILKGWIDRVFACGVAYGGGRYFSRGVFKGKRAMCSVTVGGSREVYSPVGAYGSLAHMLFPINHGILNFVGYTVVQPFVVYGPSRMSNGARKDELRRFRCRVLNLQHAPALPALDLDGYEGLIRRSHGAS
jgi:NAD(P)H dehydrogenase (quinone)